MLSPESRMHFSRHILITGASSGIGAALALLYAGPEVRLSLHGRDEKRLMDIALQATGKGAVVATKTGDVTDGAAMATWVEACDHIQPIDLIIANAGISAGTGRRVESPEQSRAVFEVNVYGVLNTIQPALPIMLQRRAGQVAIMSSLASFRGFPGAAAYCASKAAVRIYGEALRRECANHGVKVNVICPGFIRTPMTAVNRFHMPFLMKPEQAAKVIQHGLEGNQPRIAFPWPLYIMVRLLAAMPQRLLDILAAFFPQKGG